MAEVIGAIAGIASVSQVAAQIASSVIKLKSYVDQVKDAPEDIRILVAEIEDLQILLSEVEDDQARHCYSTMLLETHSASRCLDHCKRGVERLQRVVGEMELDFEDPKRMKRKWAATKMIWKRDKVEKYRADLASAVRLLTLSHQIYTRALIQIQPDIITSRITQLIQIEPSRTSSSTVSLSSTDINPSGSTERQRASRKEQLCRAKSSGTQRITSRMDFSMLTYAMVPRTSLVVQYTFKGDVEGLQRLFSSGQASPFTLFDDNGYITSLLEIGARENRYETCRLLIDQGAGTSEVAESSLESFSSWAAFTKEGFDHQHHEKLLNLLTLRSEFTYSMLRLYLGPASVFCKLLNDLAEPLSAGQQYCLAVALADNAEYNTPDMFLKALGGIPVPPSTITYANATNKRTLLHAIAGAMGLVAYDFDWAGRIRLDFLYTNPFNNRKDHENRKRILIEKFEAQLESWKTIAHDFILGGGDVHARITQPSEEIPSSGSDLDLDLDFGPLWDLDLDQQVTPLLSLFRGYYRSYRTWECRSHVYRAFHCWVTALYEAGVDLIEYGIKERAIWAEYTAAQEIEGTYYANEYTSSMFWRLIGFSPAATPESWIFWINDPTDEFAGEFWSMVKWKEEIIPGSWID